MVMDATTKIAAVAAGLVMAGAAWRWAARKWTYGDTIIRIVLAALILALPVASLFH